MEKLKQLHELLVSQKIDNKSFEEFSSNFSGNPEKQRKLHDLLVQKKIDSKPFEEFQANFFAEEPVQVKKKGFASALPSQDLGQSPVSGEQQGTVSAPTTKAPTQPQQPVAKGPVQQTPITGTIGLPEFVTETPAEKPLQPGQGVLAQPKQQPTKQPQKFGEEFAKQYGQQSTVTILQDYLRGILRDNVATEADVDVYMDKLPAEKMPALVNQLEIIRKRKDISDSEKKLEAKKTIQSTLSGQFLIGEYLANDIAKYEDELEQLNPQEYQRILAKKANDSFVASGLGDKNEYDARIMYSAINQGLGFGKDLDPEAQEEARLLVQRSLIADKNLDYYKSNPSIYESMLAKRDVSLANIDSQIKVLRENRLSQYEDQIDSLNNEIAANPSNTEAIKQRDELIKNRDKYLDPAKEESKVIGMYKSEVMQQAGATPREKLKNYYISLEHERRDLEKRMPQGAFAQTYQATIGGTAPVTDRYNKVVQRMNSIAPIVFFNQKPYEQGIAESTVRQFYDMWGGKRLTNIKASDAQVAGDILESLTYAGIDPGDISKEAVAKLRTETEGYGLSDPRFYSNMFGMLGGVGLQGMAGGVAGKAFQAPKWIATGPKMLKTIYNMAKAGSTYEITGNIFKDSADEFDFVSGVAGGAAGELFKLGGNVSGKLLKNLGLTFGENTPKAVAVIKKHGQNFLEGAAGETAEETLQDLWHVYRDTGSFKQFLDEHDTWSENLKYFIGISLMGGTMGMSTGLGKEAEKEAANAFNELTPEEQETAREYIGESLGSIQDRMEEVESKQGQVEEAQPVVTPAAEEVAPVAEPVAPVVEAAPVVTPEAQVELDALTQRADEITAILREDNATKQATGKGQLTRTEREKLVNEVSSINLQIQEAQKTQAPVTPPVQMAPTAPIEVKPISAEELDFEGDLASQLEQQVTPQEVQRDQEDIQRLPGEERVGQEPVQAEPIEGAGREAVAPGGMVQEQGQEVAPVARTEAGSKRAYDFDDTLYDPKTKKLTPLGEEVKARIAAGEDVTIVTARNSRQTGDITKALGISKDKIQATGSEAKKGEVLDNLGIDRNDYYDADQAKMQAIQRGVTPAPEAAMESADFDLEAIGKAIKPEDLGRFQQLSESLREGELLLKSGKDVSGKKLTPEKRTQIEKSVQSTKAKIQELAAKAEPVAEVETIVEEPAVTPEVKAPATKPTAEAPAQKPKLIQIANPLSQSEKDAIKKGLTVNQAVVIEDAMKQPIGKKDKKSQYEKAILLGEMTYDQAKAAIESIGMVVPDHIERLNPNKTVAQPAQEAATMQPVTTEQKAAVTTGDEISFNYKSPIGGEPIQYTGKVVSEGKDATTGLRKLFVETEVEGNVERLPVFERDIVSKKTAEPAVEAKPKAEEAKPKTSPKKTANRIRQAKIDTKGKAFDATIGLPIALWNQAIETVALAVEGGMALADAIKKGIDFINKQQAGKKWNEDEFRKKVQGSSVKQEGRPRRVVTMFSGAGTMEAALSNAESVMAVEYTPEYIEAYNNAFGLDYKPKDVTTVDPQEVIDANPDIFHASPVCKNFSAAKSKKTVEKTDMDSSNAVARVITEAKPPVVTIENVPQYEGTVPFQTIIDALEKAGYTFDVDVYNAADFGGVQNRKRLLIRAVKDGELPPVPQKQKQGDWYDAVKDLIDAAPDAPFKSRTGEANWEQQRVKEMVKQGKLDPTKPIITMGGSAFKGEAAASNAGNPSPTLKSTSKEVPRIIMPDGRVKRVTPEMMKRIMGLPDSYALPENSKVAKEVLGNGIDGAFTKALIQPLVDRQVATEEVGKVSPILKERASIDKVKSDLLDSMVKTSGMKMADAENVLQIMMAAGQSMVDMGVYPDVQAYLEAMSFIDAKNKDVSENALQQAGIVNSIFNMLGLTKKDTKDLNKVSDIIENDISPIASVGRVDSVDLLASKTAIMDLVSRLRDRVGFDFDHLFDFDRLDREGLDLPILEIIAKPIFKSIKSDDPSSLYQKLLKELSVGYGKTVFDRVANSNEFKSSSIEDQQQQAISVLLGEVAAKKIKEKEASPNLISLLKKLLGQMTDTVRSLFNSREVDVTKLSADMTLNDLANLIAFRDSKLLFPGYAAEYTTPDGRKFMSYSEASRHVSKMFNEASKALKDNTGKRATNQEVIAFVRDAIKKRQHHLSIVKIARDKLDKILDKREEESSLAAKELTQELMSLYDKIKAEKDRLVKPLEEKADALRNSVTRADGSYDLDKFRLVSGELITIREQIDEITSQIDDKYKLDEDKLRKTIHGLISEVHEKYKPETDPLYETIKENERNATNPIDSFLRTEAKFLASKNAIEKWISDNSIKYNPDEAYSRGEGFYSYIGAYADLDVEVLLQGLIRSIENNKLAGSDFILSSVTSPVGTRPLFANNTAVTVKIFPSSKDIKWAGIGDVHSGTVSDSYKPFTADKGIAKERAGIAYTKYPDINSFTAIRPSIAEVINQKQVYNELGIALTENNFRLEADSKAPQKVKDLVKKVNSVLDERYGKINEPVISTDSPIAPSITLNDVSSLNDTLSSISEKISFEPILRNLSIIANYDVARKDPRSLITSRVRPIDEIQKQVEASRSALQQANNAQFRIENDQRVVEILKDLSEGEAVAAALHEAVFHGAMTDITTASANGNAKAKAHLDTIVNEYNKANNANLTADEVIAGNEAFKSGKGVSDNYRDVQEFFARAGERYLTEGPTGFSKAMQEILDAVKEVFQQVYKSIKNSAIDVPLTPELESVFEDILGKNVTKQISEKASPQSEVKAALDKMKNAWADWLGSGMGAMADPKEEARKLAAAIDATLNLGAELIKMGVTDLAEWSKRVKDIVKETGSTWMDNLSDAAVERMFNASKKRAEEGVKPTPAPAKETETKKRVEPSKLSTTGKTRQRGVEITFLEHPEIAGETLDQMIKSQPNYYETIDLGEVLELARTRIEEEGFKALWPTLMKPGSTDPIVAAMRMMAIQAYSMTAAQARRAGDIEMSNKISQNLEDLLIVHGADMTKAGQFTSVMSQFGLMAPYLDSYLLSRAEIMAEKVLAKVDPKTGQTTKQKADNAAKDLNEAKKAKARQIADAVVSTPEVEGAKVDTERARIKKELEKAKQEFKQVLANSSKSLNSGINPGQLADFTLAATKLGYYLVLDGAHTLKDFIKKMKEAGVQDEDIINDIWENGDFNGSNISQLADSELKKSTATTVEKGLTTEKKTQSETAKKKAELRNKIRDAIANHLVNPDGRTLENVLVEDLDLSPDSAQKIVQATANKTADELGGVIKQKANSIVKKAAKELSKAQRAEVAEAKKSVTGRLVYSLVNGDLDGNQVAKDMAEYIGLPADLTPEQRQKLRDLAMAISEAKIGSKLRDKLEWEFAKEADAVLRHVGRNKKSFYQWLFNNRNANIYNALVYASMLNGIPTFLKNFVSVMPYVYKMVTLDVANIPEWMNAVKVANSYKGPLSKRQVLFLHSPVYQQLLRYKYGRSSFRLAKKEAAEALKTGRGFYNWDESIKQNKNAIDKIVESVPILERTNFIGGKWNPFNHIFGKMAGRVLTATDMLTSTYYENQEIPFAMLSEGIKAGMTKAEVTKKMNDFLSGASPEWQNALDQAREQAANAEAFGFKVSESTIQAEAARLMRENMKSAFGITQKQGQEMKTVARDKIYSYKRHGIFGTLADILSGSRIQGTAGTAINLLTKPIVPFTNIVGNMADAFIDTLPLYGMMRANGVSGTGLASYIVKGKFGKETGVGTSMMAESRSVDDRVYRHQMARATYGTLALAALMMMAGDDEEDFLYFSGPDKDPAKAYKVHIGGKPLYDYRMRPELYLPIRIVQSYKDYYKNPANKDASFGEALGLSYLNALASIKDMSFLDGIADFVEVVGRAAKSFEEAGASGENFEKFGKVLFEGLARPYIQFALKPLPTNQGIIRNIDKMIDPALENKQDFKESVAYYLGLQSYYNEKRVDIFGNVIKNMPGDDIIPLSQWLGLKEADKNNFKILQENKVNMDAPDNPIRTFEEENSESGAPYTQRKMTPKEFFEYTVLAGKKFSEKIEDYKSGYRKKGKTYYYDDEKDELYVTTSGKKTTMASKRLEGFKGVARAEALKELFGKSVLNQKELDMLIEQGEYAD